MRQTQHFLISIGVVVFLLLMVIGCVAEISPATPTQGDTVTPRPTITRWPTLTRRPTVTPTIFVTATPRPKVYDWPTSAPTFQMRIIEDKLSGSIASCKVSNPIDHQSLAIMIEPTGEFGGNYQEWIQRPGSDELIAMLNDYGPLSIIEYLDHNRDKYFINPGVQILELTGDTRKEVIIRWGVTYIYTCQDGQWSLIGEFEADMMMHPPEITKLFDGNRNGIQEFLVGIDYYGIHEFNGDVIVDITNPDDEGFQVGPSGSITLRNTDNDGDQEIILYHSNTVFYANFLYLTPYRPWRGEWETYDWDGRYYSLIQKRWSVPQYRFQAAYDGDRAALDGDYDNALALYQDVIFSDKLDWWSLERSQYEDDLFHWVEGELVPVMPEPDPDEYAYLSAYARYRIMLLYILQGWESDAEVVYHTLLDAYPAGKPGSIFANVARAFWEGYQDEGKITQGCDRAVDLVQSNQDEVFRYIGVNGQLGSGIGQYTYQDICPFE